MATTRKILSRSTGTPHGPITRLIDPTTNGSELKPFIFLDFFSAHVKPGFGFPIHPHSGIATLTWQPGTDVKYIDTMGHEGILEAGGLEWMNAGGGAWHQGALQGHGDVFGFQLWVPMPPGLEDGPPASQYVAPDSVPSQSENDVTLQVFLGRLPVGARLLESAIDAHQDMNYFVVSMAAGHQLDIRPAANTRCRMGLRFQGKSDDQRPTSHAGSSCNSSPVWVRSTLRRTVKQRGILVGSAKTHPYHLVRRSGSVHTNPESLVKGLQRIGEIGEVIRASSLSL